MGKRAWSDGVMEFRQVSVFRFQVRLFLTPDTRHLLERSGNPDLSGTPLSFLHLN